MAALYLEHDDWDFVRAKVLNDNVLQTRTLSASKRICREILSRLSTLEPSELDFLVAAYPRDQRYLLWAAVCRCYSFIADFAVEVLREHYITLNDALRHEDFDAFLNRKAEWQPELDKLQPATKKKLRQVLFRNLLESGLIDSDYKIQPLDMKSEAFRVLARHSLRDLSFFPIADSDLKELAQ